MKVIYDRIGKGYSIKRQSDPRIAEQLNQHLRGAEKILNIGAGSGSYEPKNIDLIAVEPSAEMIAQRKPDSYTVIQASAEDLPFEKKKFSHTITILSMHHWSDRPKAFAEINRVTKDKFIAISWNPDAYPFWLTRDYFPEIYKKDISIFPSIKELKNHFHNVQLHPLLIPHDCVDGFLAAYWRRPEAYLDKKVRNSISTFSTLKHLDHGLSKLEADLKTGAWNTNNKSLLKAEWFDAGYMIITADIIDK